MPFYPINSGDFYAPGASFHPTGPLVFHGPRRVLESRANPREGRIGSGVLGARLFVGLSVGDKPRWTVDDVVEIVKAVRIKQTGRAAASFISQRGLYTHEAGKHAGVTVSEKSVQVLIIDTEQSDPKAFDAQMDELGEVLAVRLRQESVLLEIQQGGLTVGGGRIVPPKPTRRPKAKR